MVVIGLRAFKGEHSTSANKAGKLPRFGAPQDTIYLGIGAGDPDSDRTPDGYVGTIANGQTFKLISLMLAQQQTTM